MPCICRCKSARAMVDWGNSSTVASRSLVIGNYFSAPDSDGYYLINTYIDLSSTTGGNPSGQSDLSNLLGFVQSTSSGAANTYKFKLGQDLNMSPSSIPYLPYLSSAEFKGNTFAVNNFSWNRSTANVGFIGAARGTYINGITVNTVSPGYIATDMVMAVPEKVRESIIGQIPAGRLGEPEEIARCVVFLASDDAGFINGSTISANGAQFFV